jgi:hypothetical protein
MTDLAFQLKYRIADEGGIEYADISELIHGLNRIPMSAIEEIYSIGNLISRSPRLDRRVQINALELTIIWRNVILPDTLFG